MSQSSTQSPVFSDLDSGLPSRSEIMHDEYGPSHVDDRQARARRRMMAGTLAALALLNLLCWLALTPH